MLRYTLVLSLLLATLLLVGGCDDRGTNITPTDLGSLETNAGIDPSRDHVFQPALSLQMRNSSELLLGCAYLPEEVFPPTKPVPMLILLAPEYGDKLYYLRAGLEMLMKEMTASGEIEPMVVYCIGNDPFFGGYFYGNSDPAGRYDDILGDSVVAFLNSFIPAIIDDPSKRGIGGIGQGAYGAFRAALKHPGVYSSVSVADGPLDFDGSTGNGGLIPLFDSALVEQQQHWTSQGNVGPFDYVNDWDTTITRFRDRPISQWLLGAAMAFSPNDTLVDFTRDINGNTISIEIDDLYQIEDSTTLLLNVIDAQGDFDFDMHLPFDASGDPYPLIWDMWMANNLEDIHDAQGGRPLDGVNMFVASTPGAKWNYYEMTQSWISFLENNNYAVEEYEYGSYDGTTVDSDQYLFDILREMLKFHSDNFKN